MHNPEVLKQAQDRLSAASAAKALRDLFAGGTHE
jgi:hypothetical protein